MLLGEYTHTLDPKKRLSLPSKFRKEIGKKVVMTNGLDRCLFLFSYMQWEKISEKLASLSIGRTDTREFNRFFLAGAQEVEVDSLGRVLIPDFLKDFASLKSRVIVTGVHDRVEIWDEEKWQEYKNRVRKEADKLAEKLGAVGVL